MSTQQLKQEHKNKRKPWHSSEDSPQRDVMCNRILCLLKDKSKSSRGEALQILTKRLEESLYCSAKSLDEYNMDTQTLKNKLQQLADHMRKRDQTKNGKKPTLKNVNVETQSNGLSSLLYQPYPIQYNNALTSPNQQKSAYFQNVQPHMLVQANPIRYLPGFNLANDYNVMKTDAIRTETMPVPMTSEERQTTILGQQQQRLLQLNHASRCLDSETCTVIPNCREMKMLWMHVSACKNQDCRVQHCISSRYVLGHYTKCKNEKCFVCIPVRHVIENDSKQKLPVSQEDIIDSSSTTHKILPKFENLLVLASSCCECNTTNVTTETPANLNNDKNFITPQTQVEHDLNQHRSWYKNEADATARSTDENDDNGKRRKFDIPADNSFCD